MSVAKWCFPLPFLDFGNNGTEYLFSIKLNSSVAKN